MQSAESQVAYVKRTQDAIGAVCTDCGAVFDVSTSPYWSWSKSRAMHEKGTGHKTRLYTLV